MNVRVECRVKVCNMQKTVSHSFPTVANGICHDLIESHAFIRWSGFQSNGSERSLANLNVFNMALNIEQQMITEHTYIMLKPVEMTTNNKIETRTFQLKMKVDAPLHELQFDLKIRYKTRIGTWSDIRYEMDKIAANQPLDREFDLVNALRTDANESLAFHIILTFSDIHYEIKQDPTVATNMTAMIKCDEIFCNPLPSRRLPDFTKKDHHPLATLQLVVGTQMLYAFPCMLACQSPVLAAQIKQPDQVLQIEEHSFQDMLLLLRLLHPATPERITPKNANQVIALAGHFQIEHLMDSAERVQCAALGAGTTQPEDALNAFNLARRFSRARLLSPSVQALYKISTEVLQTEPAFCKMDTETQCALVMAKMQLYEEMRH